MLEYGPGQEKGGAVLCRPEGDGPFPAVLYSHGFIVAAAVIGLALLAVGQATTPWHVILLFGVMGMTGLATPIGIVTFMVLSIPLAGLFLRRQPEVRWTRKMDR